eukprot:c24096_g2_i1 orf=312-554(-)
MGCCMSKQQVARANRAAKWRTTGIVGLRDSNLKSLPSEVLDLGRSVRTLDATHNRLGMLFFFIFLTHEERNPRLNLANEC